MSLLLGSYAGLIVFLDALVGMICWVKSSVLPPTQGFRSGIVSVIVSEDDFATHSNHSAGHSMTCIMCIFT